MQALILWFAAILPACAQDFYRNKTITMIVGFAPGGGIDTSARILARHLVRFIPGQPGILIQTIDGAAGIIAANYLEKRAAPDGLTIAVPGRSWFIEPMLKNANALFDPVKFSYVGATGPMNSFLWVSAGSGLTSMKELAESRAPVVFGALGAGTQTSIIGAILARSGLPIKLVTGYPGSSRLLLALQQGEVQAVFLTLDSFLLHKDLIETKKILPLLQSRPVQPDIPLLADYIPTDQRAVLDLAQAGEMLGVIVAAPANVPVDRLEILRKAFMAMANDPDYLAEVARFDAGLTPPINGARLTQAMRELAASATPQVVATFNSLKQ